MGPIQIFTDGAASGNPGPGGLGAILIQGNHRKEISEGYALTTNNRMELLAVIRALEALKRPGLDLTVYTDSRYVADAVEKGWVFEWEKKSFARWKNADLWQRFLVLFRNHKIRFIWIKGHNNHPMNERCDQLAVMASKGLNLPPDQGYLNSLEK